MAVERPWPTTPHGVDVVKIVKLRLPPKKTKKGSDVEIWRELAYDRNGIDLRTGLNVPRLRYPCFG